MKVLPILFLFGGLVHFLNGDVDPFDDKYATPPAVGELGGFSLPPTVGETVAAENAQSQYELLSSVNEFEPGQPFYLSLRLTHPQGWYSYYKNPGAVGQSITLDWQLPEGWRAGELIYPTPKAGKSGLSVSYKHPGTNQFLTLITPPKDTQIGEQFTLKTFAKWQICDPKNCLQEPGIFHQDAKTGFPLEVTLRAASAATSSKYQDAISKALASGPQNSDAWDISVRNLGQTIELVLSPREGAVSELKEVYFFADTPKLTQSAAQQRLTKEGSNYLLSIPKYTGEDAVKKFDYSTLGGVLTAKSGWEAARQFEALAVTQLSIGEVNPSELYEQVSLERLLATLGGMFLGGLILNLMPCVFPVIGLKIMGFVNQAGEDKKKIVLHGLIFVLGVLVSFWVIAGILLFFREAALSGGGEAISWGYQLQQAPVVWILMLIMFILGLSMFGLFEIGAGATSVGQELQNKSGLAGTFFSGVLATVVATPCSAPFLGPAIGLAVKLPPIEFMLAFTAMALGLGGPYLILSIFPNLVQKLPRPGAWMESFKQGMSFLLFGTAGYLLWVYLDLNDEFHGPSIVIGLTAIALAVWIYGRWFVPHQSPRARAIGMTLAAIFFLGGLYASRPFEDNSWEDWSPEKVAQALAEGRPVYVDFTAKWCITCQTNKKVAYTSEVKKAFKDNEVLLLRADKTKPNPEIDAVIAQLGRAAIPVNALYVPGKEDDPAVTPATLTPGLLLDLLKEELPSKK